MAGPKRITLTISEDAYTLLAWFAYDQQKSVAQAARGELYMGMANAIDSGSSANGPAAVQEAAVRFDHAHDKEIGLT